jgi:hypothetical protein
MRSVLATVVAVLSVVVLGVACAPAASGGGSLAPELGVGEPEAPPRVRVTNNNWSNMTVYAVRGTSRIRLGMVTSMATQVFRLPDAVAAGAGGVRLLADPIGGTEQFLTPAVQVSRGDEVKLEIHNQLQISSVSVWEQR